MSAALVFCFFPPFRSLSVFKPSYDFLRHFFRISLSYVSGFFGLRFFSLRAFFFRRPCSSADCCACRHANELLCFFSMRRVFLWGGGAGFGLVRGFFFGGVVGGGCWGWGGVFGGGWFRGGFMGGGVFLRCWGGRGGGAVWWGRFWGPPHPPPPPTLPSFFVYAKHQNKNNPTPTNPNPPKTT